MVEWFKITDNALNIEYYFWWHDYCFGLLIHDDAPFHFMVSISEYTYKQLVKTTFKSCGKPIFLEIYHTRNLNIRFPSWLHYSSKMQIFSRVQPASPTSNDKMGYYLGPIVEFS